MSVAIAHEYPLRDDVRAGFNRREAALDYPASGYSIFYEKSLTT